MANRGHKAVMLFSANVLGRGLQGFNHSSDFSRGRSDALALGITQYVLPLNRSGSAFSGPGVSLPAMGCPPTKWTFSGRYSSALAVTDCLELPTSVTTQPSGRWEDNISSNSFIATMGVARTTISAPSTAFSRRDSIRSNAPVFWAPDRAPPLESVPTTSRLSRGRVFQGQRQRGSHKSGADNRYSGHFVLHLTAGRALEYYPRILSRVYGL